MTNPEPEDHLALRDTTPPWLIITLKDGEIHLPITGGDWLKDVIDFGSALDSIKQHYPEAFKILEETGMKWIPKEPGPP